MFTTLLAALWVAAQAPTSLALARPTPPPIRSTSIRAVRLTAVPHLIARADDPAWRTVPVMSDFTQWSPREDAVPSFRTELQVAYDAERLYVRVRAFDPHPDSIVRTVTRRDGTSASDEIGVYLSTVGDHRTGYEFYINAAGVVRDVALSGDTREDVTWDAVWKAVARVDSAGWIAEFGIPFSQLRFSRSPEHQFGFLVNRAIQRRAENVSWPAYHPSRTGIVSQFGVLNGITGINEGLGVQVAPFTRAQNRGTSVSTAAGGDLRLALGPNYSVNATVLPDFGQVEADPSVVNLTSVETFFPEHRPFFVDGASTFDVGFHCNAFVCDGDELFYSRRVGRAPQLASVYDGNATGASSSEATPIVAAAKLTGRVGAGMSFGLLEASTERVADASGRTLEPATTYAVGRFQRDFRNGQSAMGLITTVVERANDSWSSPFLTRSAIVTGATFRHRFLDNQYEVWGSASRSALDGSASAIAQVQANDVHLLQRPGASLPFDSSRTMLAGTQEELAVGKYGGAHVMFEAAYERESAGFDANDLGYLARADQQSASLWAGYITRVPRAFYKSWQWNLNQWDAWTASGTRLENAYNTNTHVNLANNWWLNGGVTLGHVGAVVCDHCARGGPPLRSDRQLLPWLSLQGDNRSTVVPNLSANWTITDGGRSHAMTVNPTVAIRVSSRVQATVGLLFASNHDNTQWLGNFRDSAGVHFGFAHLEQTTRSLTFRLDYAATPRLSVESYVSPFVSDGVYSDVRALSTAPLSASYDARFTPYSPPAGTASAFGVRQLRGTSVLRWEYAPGSTLFLVWSHTRAGAPAPAVNTFSIKISYWIGR